MSEGIKKIIQDPKFVGKIMLKDMLPVKMSVIILDFAKPLLDKINLSNKSATEKTIKKAIEIWNYMIVINKTCAMDGAIDNKLYRHAMAGVAKKQLSFRISSADYHKMLERRETLYPDNNYFILEHNVRWSENDTQMHLAVVTGDANDV